MIKGTTAILFLTLISFVAFSQQSAFDSLTTVLASSKDDTNKVNLLRKVGASIIYQNAPKAIPYFKEGVALAKKLNFDPGLERCYSAVGLAYALNGKYDSGVTYIDSAVPYALKVGDIKRLALVYLNRADFYSNLQKFSEAMRNCDTAIRYAEQVNNKDGLGRIYSIVTGVQISLKQYDQAIASMGKVETYFRQAGNMQMVAMNYSDLADLYIQTNEPDKAIPLFEKAIHIGDSINDIENLSSYTNGLAQAYSLKGLYPEAQKLAEKALEYTLQTGNRTQQAMVYGVFYELNMKQNKYAAAIDVGLKAYNILVEEKDLLREQNASSNLAEAYFKSGNSEQAYKFLKISGDLNDSLIRQQFNNETAQLQTSFQVAQKDKEIQLLNKDNELQQQRLQKQRLLMIGAVALALLALGGIWLLMNRNKLRQQMKELELRNQIAADLHDEVGSSLSSIHLLSQMASHQGNETTHRDILSRMSNNTKETMDRMGDIVWMIKPGEKEADNLKQRMERFAYELSASKNIQLVMMLDDLEKAKLTMAQRKNVYLIFKEALNNAVKYSGTEKITISIQLRNKELELLIVDEGNGFDANLIKKGNGLDNIRNRAAELAGAIEIASEIGTGTTVKLSMPL